MEKQETFNELVDSQTAYMIHELVKGTPWRTIVFCVMDNALLWRRQIDDKRRRSK